LSKSRYSSFDNVFAIVYKYKKNMYYFTMVDFIIVGLITLIHIYFSFDNYSKDGKQE
jgi:hypothetical protein